MTARITDLPPGKVTFDGDLLARWAEAGAEDGQLWERLAEAAARS